MNKNAIQDLIFYLKNEVPDEQFTMGFYWIADDRCGCIAGHMVAMHNIAMDNLAFEDIPVLAAKFFGLDWEGDDYIAKRLFTFHYDITEEVTKDRAIKALEFLRDHDRVPRKWEI